MNVRSAVRRLLALVRHSRLERDLDEDIEAHLELAERDARLAGLSPDEARRAARREFGHVESMREAHRDQRSARWIEHLVKDVRFGVASLLRRPGFTLAAVSVLALGIGANAAMFSVVDAVLLRPLPFPQPDRLVRVAEISGTGAPTARARPTSSTGGASARASARWRGAPDHGSFRDRRPRSGAARGQGGHVGLLRRVRPRGPRGAHDRCRPTTSRARASLS
jgi:hypothetical protein